MCPWRPRAAGTRFCHQAAIARRATIGCLATGSRNPATPQTRRVTGISRIPTAACSISGCGSARWPAPWKRAEPGGDDRTKRDAPHQPQPAADDPPADAMAPRRSTAALTLVTTARQVPRAQRPDRASTETAVRDLSPDIARPAAPGPSADPVATTRAAAHLLAPLPSSRPSSSRRVNARRPASIS